jgi:3-oxoacyl-[acyl-carrier protein] reductase
MVAGWQKVYKVDLKLTGKKVLITGSSKGIGAAIASKFLEEGADVLIVARNANNLKKLEVTLQKKYGNNRVLSSVCDCSVEDSLLALKEFIKKEWGIIDIVIANVGSGESLPNLLPSNKEWLNSWNNNFDPALYTSRVFLPMLEKSKGNLLFISSIAALESFGAPVDYSTAKIAIVGFSKNIARQVAKNIRVNVLLPGNVLFPGGSWDKKIKSNPEAIKKLIKTSVPMNRFGTPHEIADAAVFLCSERASFITGSMLVIDGGQTVSIS